MGVAAGLLSGAAVASLAHTVLWEGLDPGDLLLERTLLAAIGNTAVCALLFGIFLLLRRAKHGGGLCTPSAALWVGAAVCLTPLAAQHWGGAPGVAATASVVFAAPLLARLTRRAEWLVWAVGGLALLAAPAARLAFDARDAPGASRRANRTPASGLPAVGAAQRPDLVLISVDTLRADALFRDETPLPAITELRRRGRWADYGLAPAPSTLPSHIAMLTGIEILEHGARSNWFRLPDRLPHLAEQLSEAGYRTAAVVSNGALRGSIGFSRGFEIYDDWDTDARIRRDASSWTWLGWLAPARVVRAAFDAIVRNGDAVHTGATRNERTVRVALEYLAALRSGSDPFFLFVHFMDPHFPYDPHPSVRGSIADPEDLPTVFEGRNPMRKEARRRMEARLLEGDAEAQRAAAYLHDQYREEVLFTDACVGRLVDAIDASGRPSAMLFTSDHGEQFGEHRKLGHANSLYETLLRIPFILVGPGIESNSRFPVVPQLEDVAPTLLGFAGVAPDPAMRGRDLRRAAEERPYVMLRNGQLALRDGRWKLIGSASYRDGERRFVPTELYDLWEDPWELADRLREESEVGARLSAAASALWSGASSGKRATLSPKERDMLIELGYAEPESVE